MVFDRLFLEKEEEREIEVETGDDGWFAELFDQRRDIVEDVGFADTVYSGLCQQIPALLRGHRGPSLPGFSRSLHCINR